MSIHVSPIEEFARIQCPGKLRRAWEFDRWQDQMRRGVLDAVEYTMENKDDGIYAREEEYRQFVQLYKTARRAWKQNNPDWRVL